MSINMRCPRCGSYNVQISMVQTGAKTHSRGTPIGQRIGRWLLIYFTLGLWLLVTKRRTYSKTKFQNEKMAICQSCGYSWKVK